MSNTLAKHARRATRHASIRANLAGTAARPRLVVFRSNKATYAQLIDDAAGKTVAAANDLGTRKATKLESAKAVGAAIAAAAKAKSIEVVVFDRAGYKYHGRVAAVATGAREAGLKF